MNLGNPHRAHCGPGEFGWPKSMSELEIEN